MAWHYSTKDFFRQMPNALLARYFQGRGLFEDLDFAAMKEGKPDELFAVWLDVPEKQRNAMDAEFRDIFEMSCEKGFQAIIDEVNWQMREDPEILASFIENLSALPNHYHRAMGTSFTLAYWRKRKHMGHKPTAVDGASINQLAGLIRNYFHRIEGRATTVWWSLFGATVWTSSLPTPPPDKLL